MKISHITVSAFVMLAPSFLAAQPAKWGKSPIGAILQTPDGKTLYVFDGDRAGSGASTCTGNCAKLWPPYLASKEAKAEGDWTLIARDDGAHQWAYRGRPVYTWVKDGPGETNGDGAAGNSWHVAKP